MAARPIAEREPSGAGTPPDDHPWRVVLLVLVLLVVVLSVVAGLVVASTSGLVSDVVHSVTSLFDQL